MHVVYGHDALVASRVAWFGEKADSGWVVMPVSSCIGWDSGRLHDCRGTQ